MKTAAMLSLAMGLTLGAGVTFAQEITLRSADIHPDGYPTVDAVKFMGDLVKERTNGRIAIQVMNNAALGTEKDTIEQTRFGVIDMNRVNSAPFNNLVPETVVFGLPFLFRDTEHMHKVVDGEIGEALVRHAPHQPVEPPDRLVFAQATRIEIEPLDHLHQHAGRERALVALDQIEV